MATGTVKFFNTTKGYGFIQPEDGSKDVFVHISAVEAAGLGTLSEGQKVSFEVVTERGRPAAGNLSAARGFRCPRWGSVATQRGPGHVSGPRFRFRDDSPSRRLHGDTAHRACQRGMPRARSGVMSVSTPRTAVRNRWRRSRRQNPAPPALPRAAQRAPMRCR